MILCKDTCIKGRPSLAFYFLSVMDHKATKARFMLFVTAILVYENVRLIRQAGPTTSPEFLRTRTAMSVLAVLGMLLNVAVMRLGRLGDASKRNSS